MVPERARFFWFRIRVQHQGSGARGLDFAQGFPWPICLERVLPELLRAVSFNAWRTRQP